MRNRRIEEIFCAVDIEQTQASFHAHAVPELTEINPGDEVLVHNVPAQVKFGERVSCRCPATVTRAGRLAQFWTRLSSLAGITELYEVGFSSTRRP
jgi:hypothetical protein